MRIEPRHGADCRTAPCSKARTQKAIAKMGRVVDKAIVTAFRARVFKIHQEVATSSLVARLPLSFDLV
jgi:hypothetical protein